MNCQECHMPLILQEDSQYVCTECGLVSSGDIFMSDWERDFYGTSIDDLSNPYTKISTFVQKGSKSLVTVNGSIKNSDIYKFHIQNSYSSKQRSFDNVESVFENISGYSDSIKKTAKELWSFIAKSNKIIRGLNRKGLFACCLYYSCIHYGCPRSPTEICNVFNIEQKVFNKSDKLFVELFQDNQEWSFILFKNSTVEDYLLRISSDLERDNIIPEGTHYFFYKKCILYQKSIRTSLFDNTDPKHVAIAIIYTVSKNEKGKNEKCKNEKGKDQIRLKKKYIVENMDMCYPTLNKIIKLLTNE